MQCQLETQGNIGETAPIIERLAVRSSDGEKPLTMAPKLKAGLAPATQNLPTLAEPPLIFFGIVERSVRLATAANLAFLLENLPSTTRLGTPRAKSTQRLTAAGRRPAAGPACLPSAATTSTASWCELAMTEALCSATLASALEEDLRGLQGSPLGLAQSPQHQW